MEPEKLLEVWREQWEATGISFEDFECYFSLNMEERAHRGRELGIVAQ